MTCATGFKGPCFHFSRVSRLQIEVKYINDDFIEPRESWSRVLHLQNEVKYINDYFSEPREACNRAGCTFMSDG